jgi:hypothetical protein
MRPDVASRLIVGRLTVMDGAPLPRVVTDAYGMLVGEEPLWAGVYAEYEREPQAFQGLDVPRTRFGFQVKVLWTCLPSNGTQSQ